MANAIYTTSTYWAWYTRPESIGDYRYECVNTMRLKLKTVPSLEAFIVLLCARRHDQVCVYT